MVTIRLSDRKEKDRTNTKLIIIDTINYCEKMLKKNYSCFDKIACKARSRTANIHILHSRSSYYLNVWLARFSHSALRSKIPLYSFSNATD